MSGAVGRRRLVVSTMERRGCTGLPALSCARECPMRDLLLDTAELSLGNVVYVHEIWSAPTQYGLLSIHSTLLVQSGTVSTSTLHEYSLQSLAVSLTIDQMREQASREI